MIRCRSRRAWRVHVHGSARRGRSEPEQARASARLAAHRGDSDRIEPEFETAESLFRQAENPFWLAVTLLDHGEWLISEQRPAEAEALLQEARKIFERLRAVPWLERVSRVAPQTDAAAI